MKKYSMETIVGIFVVVGLICVGYLSVKLGKVSLFHEQHLHAVRPFHLCRRLKGGQSGRGVRHRGGQGHLSRHRQRAAGRRGDNVAPQGRQNLPGRDGLDKDDGTHRGQVREDRSGRRRRTHEIGRHDHEHDCLARHRGPHRTVYLRTGEDSGTSANPLRRCRQGEKNEKNTSGGACADLSLSRCCPALSSRTPRRRCRRT